MQVEDPNPSPSSTLPPAVVSKIAEWTWEILLEEPAQKYRPIQPNDTSSARAAHSLLSTLALVSKSWHAATLPFAVRHAFTAQNSLPPLLDVLRKYTLESAVRAVRIRPDTPPAGMIRSLSDAYAPWIPLLSACPNIEEISFENFTSGLSRLQEVEAPAQRGFTLPAFGQWPTLPLVRRLRLVHTNNHNFKLSDVYELSCLTPNLTELELDSDAFEDTAADATAPSDAEPHWPRLRSLVFNRIPRRTIPQEYIRLLEAAAGTLVAFRVKGTGSPSDPSECFTGSTHFPHLTTLDHPFPLELPHDLAKPLFPALTHLTISFSEVAPTPAILTLFTPTLVELAIDIPSLEGWLPILRTTCTTTPSLRLLELETLDSSADLPPFSLPELRNLAQVCAEEQVVFATSDTRVWATDDDEMDWEEQDYVEGQPRQDSDSDDDGTSNRTKHTDSESGGREYVEDDSDSSGSDDGVHIDVKWLKNKAAYEVTKKVYEVARPHLAHGVTREDFAAAIAPLFRADSINQ